MLGVHNFWLWHNHKHYHHLFHFRHSWHNFLQTFQTWAIWFNECKPVVFVVFITLSIHCIFDHLLSFFPFTMLNWTSFSMLSGGFLAMWQKQYSCCFLTFDYILPHLLICRWMISLLICSICFTWHSLHHAHYLKGAYGISVHYFQHPWFWRIEY